MYFLIFLFLVCITPNADADSLFPFLNNITSKKMQEESFEPSEKSYHIIADFNGCNPEILDSPSKIKSALEDALYINGFHKIRKLQHKFSPQGVTMLYLLSESHLSIHTWPETGYAAVDLFTCGSNSPEEAVKFIKKKLECKRGDYALLERRSEFKSIETVK